MRVEAAVLASPVPDTPYGLCGRKAALEEEEHGVKFRVQELCERRGGRPGLPVPNSPHGLCGRKATQNETTTQSSRAV